MMEGIRILHLAAADMLSSGDRPLNEFDDWFSKIHATGADAWFPRDFMWFDEVLKKLIWAFALPTGYTNDGGFYPYRFPGGLYAVAISTDEDDKDGERVFAAIKEWIDDSSCFDLDLQPGIRECIFHVVTPDEAYRAMGYRQLDIFVPIRIKEVE